MALEGNTPCEPMASAPLRSRETALKCDSAEELMGELKAVPDVRAAAVSLPSASHTLAPQPYLHHGAAAVPALARLQHVQVSTERLNLVQELEGRHSGAPTSRSTSSC
jgi:hypothetical protein